MSIYIFSSWQLYAQEDKLPSNLIEILSEKNAPARLDSLINREFDDYREILQTSKPPTEIASLLKGCLIRSGSVRINMKSSKIKTDLDSVFFSENGRFQIFKNGNMVEGSFVIEQGNKHNLILKYDELQPPPLPKEMLDDMSEEQIRAQSFNQSLMNIFEVEDNILVFFLIKPLFNPEAPGLLTHSRLVLNYFLKNENCTQRTLK